MINLLSLATGRWILFFAAAAIISEAFATEDGPPADSIHLDRAAIGQLKKDAERGDGRAQYLLGCCYNGDYGMPRDPAEAARWWGLAAAKGIADAQYCFGLTCYLGAGIRKDEAKAADWWEKAAGQGHPGAQYLLGLSYCSGLGVAKSRPLALYWLQKSADSGNKAARDVLKEMGH
jgi:TPR repeat protein